MPWEQSRPEDVWLYNMSFVYQKSDSETDILHYNNNTWILDSIFPQLLEM